MAWNDANEIKRERVKMMGIPGLKTLMSEKDKREAGVKKDTELLDSDYSSKFLLNSHRDWV